MALVRMQSEIYAPKTRALLKQAGAALALRKTLPMAGRMSGLSKNTKDVARAVSKKPKVKAKTKAKPTVKKKPPVSKKKDPKSKRNSGVKAKAPGKGKAKARSTVGFGQGLKNRKNRKRVENVAKGVGAAAGGAAGYYGMKKLVGGKKEEKSAYMLGAQAGFQDAIMPDDAAFAKVAQATNLPETLIREVYLTKQALGVLPGIAGAAAVPLLGLPALQAARRGISGMFKNPGGGMLGAPHPGQYGGFDPKSRTQIGKMISRSAMRNYELNEIMNQIRAAHPSTFRG